jgi:hypothetical protein
MSKNNTGLVVGCAFYLTTLLCAHADQVNMQNGDRFVGKVVTVSNETVVVQSDVLGTLLVPRSKIATIVLGTNAIAAPVQAPAVAAAQPAPPAAAPASANPNLSAAIQQLRTDTNAVRQVQKQVQQQILAGADPQATEMFNQMIGGLMNGSLNVDDIRAQAKTAADQLRAAKKELGDEAGFAVDGYLAVLDGFLRETASTSAGTATNAPVLPSKPKRGQLFDEE